MVSRLVAVVVPSVELLPFIEAKSWWPSGMKANPQAEFLEEFRLRCNEHAEDLKKEIMSSLEKTAKANGVCLEFLDCVCYSSTAKFHNYKHFGTRLKYCICDCIKICEHVAAIITFNPKCKFPWLFVAKIVSIKNCCFQRIKCSLRCHLDGLLQLVKTGEGLRENSWSGTRNHTR